MCLFQVWCLELETSFLLTANKTNFTKANELKLRLVNTNAFVFCWLLL